MRVWLRVSCATTMGGTTGRSIFIQVEDDGSELYDLSQLPEATDPMIDRSTVRWIWTFNAFDRA
jgi:hypothetical protein